MAEQTIIQILFNGNTQQFAKDIHNVSAEVLNVEHAFVNVDNTFHETVNNINNDIKQIKFSTILDQVDRVVSGIQNIAAPGMQFSSTLADVSAITGVTGAALDNLAERARASALEFGGNASDSLNTYKVILSRLGPDIAAAPEALEAMEHQVRTLSKTMGGDAVAAVDAMTTAALQFGIDLSDPITAAAEMDKMMNVMAAGSQKGAAEVPRIADALKVTGVAAKQMNVSFEESNAALQALAKGGKEGSEAGTALRNVLGKMAGVDVIPKEAREKLESLGVNYDIVSDKTRPFADRLRELSKAQGDATILAQVFGVENAAAANILLDSIDAQEEMTRAITDTNVAYEMAAVVMESPAEKAERIKAKIEDLKLSIFDGTGGVLLYADALAETGRMLNNLAPLYNITAAAVTTLINQEKRAALFTSIWSGKLGIKTIALKAASIGVGIFSGAMRILNNVMRMNPVLLIVSGVAALGAGIYAVTGLFKSNSKAVEINNEVHKRAASRAADETAELNIMIERLKNTTAGTDTRRVAMQALMQKYPDYLKDMDLEKASMEEINKLHTDIADNIMKRAEAEVRAEMYKEKVRERMEAEMEGPSMGDYARSISSLGLKSAQDYNNERIAGMKEEEAILVKQMEYADKGIKGGLAEWMYEAKNKLKEFTDLKNKALGITIMDTSPDLKGLISPIVNPGTFNSNKTETKETNNIKKTNTSIATGGQRTVNNTFNIKSLIEQLTIAGKNFKESAAKMEEEATDALIRTLSMAAATAG